MEQIHEELQRLAERQAAKAAAEASALEDTLERLRAAEARLAAPGAEAVAAQLARELEALAPADRAMAAYKSFHSGVSKLGKRVEKARPLDFDVVGRAPPLSEAPLRELVVLHCYRSGYLRTAAMLREHWRLQLAEAEVAALCRLHGIASALQARDLAPALRWLAERRGGTGELEFMLVRLQFFEILSQPGEAVQEEALAFAQERFPDFAASHMREIQRCMGALLWAGRLKASPYVALAGDEAWDRTIATFMEVGCEAEGLPMHSHLLVTFVAGLQFVPILAKMLAVVVSDGDWTQVGERLPAEVALPPEFTFHSLFSCPVTRDEADRDNPPVVLRCGHVILRSSLAKLTRVGGRVKCPTCPREMRAEEVEELYIG
uniref:RING-Gid-type domain-containing protein n=1 Tax=Phaeomonas parva TaxID=124430 RepID=A0A7S1U8N9_9STRA|mmetsp:Transcript_36719/g.115011  ORF Transcript_36719/g.115011 Transcript_36719/m.115011 type:complete len:376 (+) Transcript_36719:153-1280(+)|eukprot:CAMPEP_0118864632 /NCGR_PEP_ID=MMETSP1163-20130328/9146_1 /TAXON_ID=124430 /ORGANISM="Phaeomonas parva, Strain CCMP2877" /LENGTH=375 /DNA_ID=CAMNT_0006798779 /DNA_START=299 /DNA_END=1426 /DNA_ORIENTATION=+